MPPGTEGRLPSGLRRPVVAAAAPPLGCLRGPGEAAGRAFRRRLLAGIVASVTAGCAGADRGAGDPATVAGALQASLASARASLAALGPASDGTPGAVRRPAGAAAGTPSPSPHRAAPAPRRGASTVPPHDPPRVAAPPAPPLPPGPAPRRAAAEGPPLAEAAQLLGLPAESVVRRLGEPALRRPEGPAEIWLYTARSCALDVILYREEAAPSPPALRAAGGGSPPAGAATTDAAGALRVAFAAARAAGTEPRSEAACLREIAGGGGPGAARATDPPLVGAGRAGEAQEGLMFALAGGRG